MLARNRQKNTFGEMRAARRARRPWRTAPTTIAAVGEARPIDGLITAPLRDDRLSGGLFVWRFQH
jgi:hypothetical protein